MKRVKQFASALALGLLVGVSLFVLPASAHVLESDNGVSAILHLVPDDRPIAGKELPINLLFSNDVGGFKLNDYKVQVRLLEDDAVRFSGVIQPKFFGSASEAEGPGTFPTAGDYTVEIKGVPITKTAPTFTLLFDDVRVIDSASVAKTGNGTVTAILSAFGLIIIAMIAGQQIRAGGKYKKV
ncbi:hypothetical protein H7Y63_00815 [Polaromonas sp.]|nr:hypothetical protein [Candidatus Saccharibacteria bacterium]